MIVSNRILNKKIVYENYFSPSIINLQHYLAENYEDEFISATDDSDLILSNQMSAVKTTSMVSGVGLNISQLRILLSILRKQ